MQSSGPAARPGPEFRPGRALCGARSKSAGIMLGSGETISMYYALADRLHAVLERCWPGSMLGSGDLVRCRSGLGLDFWRNYNTSSSCHPISSIYCPSAKRCPPRNSKVPPSTDTCRAPGARRRPPGSRYHPLSSIHCSSAERCHLSGDTYMPLST